MEPGFESVIYDNHIIYVIFNELVRKKQLHVVPIFGNNRLIYSYIDGDCDQTG